MNPILQPVDAELTRLDNLVASLEAQLATKPPPTAKSFPDLGLLPWEQPGNVGDSGGGSFTRPHGTSVVTLGNPMSVKIAPVGAYDNFYFLQRKGPFPSLTQFTYTFTLSFPTAADLAACQAFEWEVQQLVNGTVWNMAWQLDFADTHQLRLFNYNANKWLAFEPLSKLDPGILVPGHVSTITAEHSIDPQHETHIDISLNGQRFAVSVSQLNTPNKYPGQNGLNIAFQLDGNASGTPYTARLGNMSVNCS